LSASDLRAALARILGAKRGSVAWQEACRAVQIARPGPPLTLAQALRLADHLKTQAGAAQVVGHSLSVRLRTHQHRPPAQPAHGAP